jgi:Uma2 family endonuclease
MIVVKSSAIIYRECPTVEEYVLVNTKRQLVEVFRRTAEGWTAYHIYGPEDVVELTSIGVHIPVAALYEVTDVPQIFSVPKDRI